MLRCPFCMDIGLEFGKNKSSTTTCLFLHGMGYDDGRFVTVHRAHRAYIRV